MPNILLLILLLLPLPNAELPEGAEDAAGPPHRAHQRRPAAGAGGEGALRLEAGRLPLQEVLRQRQVAAEVVPPLPGDA